MPSPLLSDCRSSRLFRDSSLYLVVGELTSSTAASGLEVKRPGVQGIVREPSSLQPTLRSHPAAAHYQPSSQFSQNKGRGNLPLPVPNTSFALKMRLLIFICVLSVSSGKNFISDPVCPAATAQSSCAGRRSTCWSPGVRDLDCPGSGLCCYDGCANTCVSESRGSASIQQPQYSPPPTTRRPYQPPTTTRRPYQPPSTTRRTYQPPTTTKAPYRPPPFNSYIPPAPKPVTFPQQSYIPPLASPTPSYSPPQPQPRPTPSPSYGPPLAEVQQPSIKVEVVRPTSRPTHGGSGSCPRATPLSQSSCGGRHSTCWSPGVADLDCPNWGLCCFDGCANTCLGSTPAPRPTAAPRQPRPPRNPCDPNPCGPGSMCIPQEGEPECKCPEGLVPNPTPAQGCVVPNPCDPNPCGDGSMCIPNEGRPTCKCPEGLVPDPTPEVRCSARDPCDPSPCGPGTTCTPNRDGNPICRCLVGLIPKPDTITGCGPECVIDPDCDGGLVCLDRKCVDKPDPCNPSPCGPGTTCSANRDGNPICRCLSGLIPKPDTITGKFCSYIDITFFSLDEIYKY